MVLDPKPNPPPPPIPPTPLEPANEPVKPPPPNPVVEILGEDPKIAAVEDGVDVEDSPGMEGAAPNVGAASGVVDPKPPAPKPEEPPNPPPNPDMVY